MSRHPLSPARRALLSAGAAILLALSAGAARAQTTLLALGLEPDDPAAAEATLTALQTRMSAWGIGAKARAAVPEDGAGVRIVIEAADPGALDLGALLRPGRLGFYVEQPSDADPNTPALELPWDAEFDPANTALGPLLLTPEPVLSGPRVVSARAEQNAWSDGFVVNLKLDGPGARALGRATEGAVGRRMALALDEKIVIAPVVALPIHGGALQISGDFSRARAERLARLIAGPQLPATPILLESRVPER